MLLEVMAGGEWADNGGLAKKTLGTGLLNLGRTVGDFRALR